MLTNEVRVTKKANHLNIIELYDQIESEDSLYLVLECADGGELFEMIVADGRFSEPVAKVYFLQMLNAVKYLHSIQITHRDLKPENVLVGHRVEDVSNKDSETAANHHRIIKIADMGKLLSGNVSFYLLRASFYFNFFEEQKNFFDIFELKLSSIGHLGKV